MEPESTAVRPTDVHGRPSDGGRRPLRPRQHAPAVTLLVGPSPSASAGLRPRGQGTKVQISATPASTAGTFGRRLPVTVDIEADRLVRGHVEVAVDGLTGTWSTPVEVPGGSDKDVVVVVADEPSRSARGACG